MKTSNHLFLLIWIVWLGSNCSGAQKSAEYWVPSSEMDKLSERSEALPDAPPEQRKILYSAYLTLAVDQPDSTSKQIERIASKYGGYVNEIGTYNAIIRVKSDQLEAAVGAISALGKVQQKRLEGQDVTSEYLDYQIRLDNAQKARDRYLELLAKAENVEAALQVEKELERLNGTIDMLKGRMNRIDHLSDFSTITISIKEKKKPGVLGYVGIGVYQAFKWLFVRN